MQKILMSVALIAIVCVGFFIFYFNSTQSIIDLVSGKRNLLADADTGPIKGGIPILQSGNIGVKPLFVHDGDTGTTTVGCKTRTACNYNSNATTQGKCSFANFGQVAPPPQTGTSALPKPYWVVDYRIENADKSIFISGSYRYVPPPNSPITLGGNACATRIGQKTVRAWLNSLIPPGE